MQYLYCPNLRQKHKNRVWSPPGIEPTSIRLPPRVETTQRNSDAHTAWQYHIHTKQISDKKSSPGGIAHVCVARRCTTTQQHPRKSAAWVHGEMARWVVSHVITSHAFRFSLPQGFEPATTGPRELGSTSWHQLLRTNRQIVLFPYYHATVMWSLSMHGSQWSLWCFLCNINGRWYNLCPMCISHTSYQPIGQINQWICNVVTACQQCCNSIVTIL